METKNCPYCGEEILAAAKKCKHCGEWLEKPDQTPSVPPASTLKEEPKTEQTEQPAKSDKTVAETNEPAETPGFFDYYLNEVWALKSSESNRLFPHFDFEGVLPRKRFWISLLLVWCTFGVIVNTLFTPAIIMRIFSDLSFLHKIWGVVALFIMPCFYVKLFEMIARRVRDTGRSGWWALVPFVNFVFCCQKGSPTAKTSWGKKDWAGVIFIIIIIVAVNYASNIEREYFGEDSDNMTYAVPGTKYYPYSDKWVKSEDGSCYYTVMSTDKSDVEENEVNYENKGILTVVSAPKPGGNITPIVGTADFSLRDDSVESWSDISLSANGIFPSSEYPNILYINYFVYCPQDSDIQRYIVLDCKTGEFDIMEGQVFGIIRKGTYAGCYLASDAKYISDMDTLYIITQFRPDEYGTYRDVQFDYNNTMMRFLYNYAEIVNYIEQN